MADYEVLFELFFATKGHLWLQNWRWNSTESYSKWHGVKAGLAGHVDQILLRANMLQGSLTPIVSWKLLVNIRVLCLSDNRITGCIPKGLGVLVTLETLDLAWNLLAGPAYSIHYVTDVSRCLMMQALYQMRSTTS